MSDPNSSRPPPINHVLETVLYVKNKEKSADFYTNIMGLKPFLDGPSITGYALPNSCLLLFQLGLTSDEKPLPAEGPSKGLIPGDGPTKDLRDRIFANSDDKGTSSGQNEAKLRQHFCLAVHERGDVDKWEKWFEENGVEITGRVDWERGGRSVYFNDPDGHVGEVASRGVWPHY